jgi:TolB-like protein/Tfp pilus assembly protein PilF
VVFEDHDVFGDGVNIASRLQAGAPAGKIWVSESVYSNVSNKKDFKAKFIEGVALKNVRAPLNVYEIEPTHSLRPGSLYASPDPAPRKSIAVMPFINMSSDPEQEYFSEGIAEEIINALAHIKGLKVAGRMSSWQFKDTRADLKEIGDKLGVSTVLEGSIRKHDNRVRVTVQLIGVEDGFQLWSEKFDRDIDDIFSIQDEIALTITNELKVTLMEKERALITKSHTQSHEAYELYLKGRFYTTRRGASILTGIKHYQRAFEIDPEFALAYAGYADANLLLSTYGLAPPAEIMLRAKQFAEKAISLDPTLCEPYCSLAYYYTCYEWNWKEAKKNFLKAIELNPRYAEVHLRFGCNYLSWVEGNFDAGIRQGETAIKVEPLHSICYGTQSLILQTAGRFEEALDVCQAGIELDPNSFLCILNRGNILTDLGRYQEAVASHETAMAISNRHHFAINGLIWAYARMGNPSKAEELMAELKERAATEYITKTFSAMSAAHLNNIDDAFMYLDKAYEEREPIILTLKHAVWIPQSIKNDPRYNVLLDKIGFP